MTDERIIWEYLAAKIGNAYGAAAMMGNLRAESALNPKNLQNSFEPILGMNDEEYVRAVDSGEYDGFVTDAAGFGLAQWTAQTRKAGLLNYAWAQKTSIGDLQTQLEYLWQELNTGYKGVLEALLNAKDVRTASDAVLTRFEIPRDQSEGAKRARAEYGEAYYAKYAAEAAPAEPAEPAKEAAPAAQPVKVTGQEFMTAAELIRWLKYAASLPTIYMYAAYGFQVTTATIQGKSRQNLDGWYTQKNIDKLMAVANRKPPVWGFDCVNLLKAILWGWRADESQAHGGAKYKANGVPDTSADGMIGKCYDVSADFSTGLLPGEGLWCSGHWGTYIGDGLAIECTTRWTGKVQITAVANIGAVKGHNSRTWTKHGKLPWIYYGEGAIPTPSAPGEIAYTGLIRRGSTGAKVRELQNALNELGYDCGAADGDFGPKTEAALMRFQTAAKIAADGQFGPVSCKALNAALKAREGQGGGGTPETYTVVVTAAQSAWVREGPGTEHRKVTAVKRGERLTADQVAENGWFHVKTAAGAGWISGRMAKREGEVG